MHHNPKVKMEAAPVPMQPPMLQPESETERCAYCGRPPMRPTYPSWNWVYLKVVKMFSYPDRRWKKRAMWFCKLTEERDCAEMKESWFYLIYLLGNPNPVVPREQIRCPPIFYLDYDDDDDDDASDNSMPSLVSDDDRPSLVSDDDDDDDASDNSMPSLVSDDDDDDDASDNPLPKGQ
jgi:hypothetical protein